MKIHDRIYIAASGESGINLTNKGDCTVYLVDGEEEYALIDCGLGDDPEKILEVIKGDGLDPYRIQKIFLTHGHGDHAGGAAALKELLHAEVYALPETADYVTRGDEEALSVACARNAGVYAEDFSFKPCKVTQVTDGQRVNIGKLSMTVHRTEGHCVGHACYELHLSGKTILFSGDSVFYGGKISLQPLWDCNINEYIKTCKLLNEIRPDLFLPAHGLFSLAEGYVHVEKALAAFEKLSIPENTV